MIKVHWNTTHAFKSLKEFEESEFYKETLKEVADYLVADVISSFSPLSPSAPYNPPAVDLGNFLASLGYKRTVKPSKALGNRVWSVKFHTDKAKRDYAVALEYGTPNMAPRPYLEPAIERVMTKYPFIKVTMI